MKQSEYIPISVREKIEDKDIAKIVNYLERVGKDFEFLGREKIVMIYQYSFICNGFSFKINKKTAYIDELRIRLPTKLLSDNIVGIWGSLKNL